MKCEFIVTQKILLRIVTEGALRIYFLQLSKTASAFSFFYAMGVGVFVHMGVTPYYGSVLFCWTDSG